VADEQDPHVSIEMCVAGASELRNLSTSSTSAISHSAADFRTHQARIS
jgi:hypothetical protein